MAAARLIAPDLQGSDTLWRSHRPFVLWPVGPRPLLAHWMDEMVRRGVREVEILAADRPAEVRAFVGDGGYWSRKVSVAACPSEPAPGPGDEVMLGLPGGAAAARPADAAALLRHWLRLHEEWAAGAEVGEKSVLRRLPSGAIVGPHARLADDVRVEPPCWVGERATVGRGARLGPGAFVGERCVIGDGCQVARSVVLPDTFVGDRVGLDGCVADGGVLVNVRLAARVEIAERFLLSSLRRGPRGGGLAARAAALLAWALLLPFAPAPSACASMDWAMGDGRVFRLLEGRRGPIWRRRHSWLRHVAAGRMRWIGVLPRPAAAWEAVPADLRGALSAAAPGLVSLADAHGCHAASDPEEWVHAAYQALADEAGVRRMLARRLVSLLRTVPPHG
jgi:carbonic anhydrase/acetyltransferase-like protein (isoleucine patch superfamily)